MNKRKDPIVDWAFFGLYVNYFMRHCQALSGFLLVRKGQREGLKQT
jgi:hypothetical protein